MAPSVGHLHKLVTRNVKLLKTAWKNTLYSLRLAEPQLQPIPVRVRQPLHPIAYLRQNKARWYTTHSKAIDAARQFSTGTTRGLKYDRASFPKSRTAGVVNTLTGRAPFASTLRPNITGGALGRTAGGYTLGSGRIGGARHFSHSPTAPAQVIQNVSQAVRAFCLSGQKAQYNGINPHNGEKRYRAVSSLQKDTTRKMQALPRATPGSYIDFQVNPTITALTPLSAIASYSLTSSTEKQHETLNTEGLLDILSIDFSRSLQDLAAILNDLKRLSSLGDLLITYTSSSTLRIHFPGCDAETVEKLCEEIGVQRGIVTQDEEFDAFVGTEIALLFPFAPSKTTSESERPEMEILCSGKQRDSIEWQNMLSSEDDNPSIRSEAGIDPFQHVQENHCVSNGSSPEGYESMRSHRLYSESQEISSPLEYQDFEGIYRFIELCDAAKR